MCRPRDVNFLPAPGPKLTLLSSVAGGSGAVSVSGGAGRGPTLRGQQQQRGLKGGLPLGVFQRVVPAQRLAHLREGPGESVEQAFHAARHRPVLAALSEFQFQRAA